MKSANINEDDDLRPEYDLKTLKVRKLGPERKSFGSQTIRLEPDVASAFPNSQAVNEALRFLMRVTKENTPLPHSHTSA